MPTRAEFHSLVLSRLAEARLLFQNGFYDGAIYLAGYSLEFAFKARICKILNSDYPTSHYKSFYTRKYNELVVLAGLEKTLEEQKTNPLFFTN